MNKKNLFASITACLLIFFIHGCQSGTGEGSGVKASGQRSAAIDYNMDMGGQPWAMDIEEGTLGNDNYRAANWTGSNIQLVFMSLKPGEVIDLEVHDDHDQFFRIEQGEARILMGKTRDDLSYDKRVSDDWSVLVPAGYWHKVENVGTNDLKLYTIYGPPEHQKGTVHKTYNDAEKAHHHEHGQ
ncbi:MAG TPA: cupin domain-containing protein [Bacteroidales bacterium]|nr:cupin domain-containing protein [Bacteroidales bacterium]